MRPRLRDPAAARILGRLLVWAAVIGLVGAGAIGFFAESAEDSARAQQADATGSELYAQSCAGCHGVEGNGTQRGPSLVGAGAASADFYLSSGRMPIDEPEEEAKRSEPHFTDEQIGELVDYVAQLGGGPPVPELDLPEASLARGGELYRANCASCHNWDGKGGALVNRENAPPLHAAPPVQVAEAVRIGPGTMPEFAEEVLSDEELDDVVAYVEYLDSPADRGGFPLAHWGPSTEGLASLLLLGGLLLLSAWLGERA